MRRNSTDPLFCYDRYSIIPTADEHQSEWTSHTDQRREYLTGFNGSAGTALVKRISSTSDANSTNSNVSDKTEPNASAWLFVDNRYWIQAEAQTSKELWDVVSLVPRDSGKGYVGVWDWAKEVSVKMRRVKFEWVKGMLMRS